MPARMRADPWGPPPADNLLRLEITLESGTRGIVPLVVDRALVMAEAGQLTLQFSAGLRFPRRQFAAKVGECGFFGSARGLQQEFGCARVIWWSTLALVK